MIAFRFFLASWILTVWLGCGSNKPTPLEPGNISSDVHGEATDSEDPIEIVRAAIEAHGGESNFAKANIGQTTMTIDGALRPGMSGQFIKFDIFDLPGKHKRRVRGEVQGQEIDMNVVSNGEKAWIQRNGGEPASLPIVGPSQGVYPNDNLGVLLSLQEPGIQFSVDSTDIDGKPAYRLRMEVDGEWVGDLFFDKETHLLVASKKELFDSNIGKSRAIETYYSDYKIVDELNLPMSIITLVDGQATATIRVTEVEFMDEIAEDVFAKPVAQN